MNRSARLVQFVLCLFAMPFALGGLLAISQAIAMTHADNSKMPSWLLLSFGLVFSGMGFGLIFTVIYGGKHAQRQQQLQAEHPADLGFGAQTGLRAAPIARPAPTWWAGGSLQSFGMRLPCRLLFLWCPRRRSKKVRLHISA